MTIGELRRYLNTLPLNSDGWPVVALDSDTADLFDVHKLSVGNVNDAPALVFGAAISD